MENKFGLNIDFVPNDCISFLEDVGILTKTQEGRTSQYFREKNKIFPLLILQATKCNFSKFCVDFPTRRRHFEYLKINF